MNLPSGLAFDKAGNLFVASNESIGGNGTPIFEITPGGVVSTFVSGLGNSGAIEGLAFDGAGNLYASTLDGTIDKITPDGVVSTFATGLDSLYGLAFAPTTQSVPEPSGLTLMGIGALALAGTVLARRRA